jgi:hypothetical protein
VRCSGECPEVNQREGAGRIKSNYGYARLRSSPKFERHAIRRGKKDQINCPPTAIALCSADAIPVGWPSKHITAAHISAGIAATQVEAEKRGWLADEAGSPKVIS